MSAMTMANDEASSDDAFSHLAFFAAQKAEFSVRTLRRG
jgi:hypothetical protein